MLFISVLLFAWRLSQASVKEWKAAWDAYSMQASKAQHLRKTLPKKYEISKMLQVIKMKRMKHLKRVRSGVYVRSGVSSGVQSLWMCLFHHWLLYIYIYIYMPLYVIIHEVFFLWVVSLMFPIATPPRARRR